MSVETAVERPVAVGASGDPLRRALQLLGIRRRALLKSMALGAGGALSALGLATLSAWLITRAWMMPPVLSLMMAVTTVRALGISRGLLRYLERLATHDMALDAMSRARARMYTALASGAPGYSVTLRRSDLLARTGDDVDEIGESLIRALIPIGVAAVTSVAAVIVVAIVSPWAAAVTALALLASGVAAPMLAARGARRSEIDSDAARDRSTEATTTLLWHGAELAVARRRRELVDEVASAEKDVVTSRDRGVRVSAIAAGTTPAAIGVSVLAAALIGIGLSGSVSPMVLGVLLLVPLSSFETTGPLVAAGTQLQRSRNAARRVMALVDGADESETTAQGGDDRVPDVVEGDLPAPIAEPVTLRIEGLRWGFPGARVLGPRAGLNLVCEPGARVAVVGPSGAGKTTLLLTLAGLLAPQSGSVSVCADHVDQPRECARFFAEDAHVFSTSIRENLLVSRGDATTDELRSACERVGLWEWISGLPDGLDTVLTGGADALSGGQRRRLLLARALINTAPVVLLDEPAEHLDRADSERVQRELLSRNGLFGPDRTVVMVTHRLPRTADPDHIIVVD